MEAEEGKTLLEVAHENDIELEGACVARNRCRRALRCFIAPTRKQLIQPRLYRFDSPLTNLKRAQAPAAGSWPAPPAM